MNGDEWPGAPADPPLDFDVDGESWWCDPGWSPPRWLAVIARADLAAIIDTIGPGPRVAARLYDPDDPFDLPDLIALAVTAGAAVAGCPWPVAVRLAAAATSSWMAIEGAVAEAGGTDPARWPPRRIVALTKRLLLASCENEKEGLRMEAKMADPRGIPGASRRPSREQSARDADAAAFMALRAQFPIGINTATPAQAAPDPPA